MDAETIQCLRKRAIQCPHDFFWVAEDTEGKLIPQFDDAGERMYREVLDLEKHNRLKRLHLLSTNGTHRHFSTPDLAHQDFRAIHFRRNFINWDMGTGREYRAVAYALGYQRTLERDGEKTNEKTITFITPDGDIISEQELYDNRGVIDEK